jgi:hypothetical protein
MKIACGERLEFTARNERSTVGIPAFSKGELANDCIGGIGRKAGSPMSCGRAQSLTPFSNENGVTLMAIGYREYQVGPDCA